MTYPLEVYANGECVLSANVAPTRLTHIITMVRAQLGTDTIR